MNDLKCFKYIFQANIALHKWSTIIKSGKGMTFISYFKANFVFVPQTMYANFVVSGSAQDVHVHRDIQLQVHKELEPPYEELFDAVEEHILHSLLEPWNLLIAHEKESYRHEVGFYI